jgi:DNA-binding transcriptional ArsR family regulator
MAGSDEQLAAELAALGHPIRLRIMRAALATDHPAASALDASRLLGETLNLVSYHARVLRRVGLLATVELVHRRGAVQHRYAPSPRAHELFGLLGQLER